MRYVLYSLSGMMVVALAYWAYQQGYETRQTGRDVSELQKAIGTAREQLAVLKGEWAYLNRPDRLHALAEMNFERLGLMPLSADQFGTVAQVGYPPITLPPTVLAEGPVQGLGDVAVLRADSRLIGPLEPALAPEAQP